MLFPLELNSSSRQLTALLLMNNQFSSISEGTDDIALNRPTKQSSTFSLDTGASKATDGSTMPWFDAHSFSLTRLEAQPWWHVDLGELHMIARIEVYAIERSGSLERHGLDECSLQDTKVIVYDGDTAKWSAQLKVHRQHYRLWLDPVVMGHLVELRRTTRSKLCLAEVLVFPTQ